MIILLIYIIFVCLPVFCCEPVDRASFPDFHTFLDDGIDSVALADGEDSTVMHAVLSAGYCDEDEGRVSVPMQPNTSAVFCEPVDSASLPGFKILFDDGIDSAAFGFKGALTEEDGVMHAVLSAGYCDKGESRVLGVSMQPNTSAVKDTRNGGNERHRAA